MRYIKDKDNTNKLVFKSGKVVVLTEDEAKEYEAVLRSYYASGKLEANELA